MKLALISLFDNSDALTISLSTNCSCTAECYFGSNSDSVIQGLTNDHVTVTVNRLRGKRIFDIKFNLSAMNYCYAETHSRGLPFLLFTFVSLCLLFPMASHSGNNLFYSSNFVQVNERGVFL